MVESITGTTDLSRAPVRPLELSSTGYIHAEFRDTTERKTL